MRAATPIEAADLQNIHYVANIGSIDAQYFPRIFNPDYNPDYITGERLGWGFAREFGRAPA